MAQSNPTVPSAFDDTVQDFIVEQLQREPFFTVCTAEEQLAQLLGKFETIEKKVVRCAFSPRSVHSQTPPAKAADVARVKELETAFTAVTSRTFLFCSSNPG